MPAKNSQIELSTKSKSAPSAESGDENSGFLYSVAFKIIILIVFTIISTVTILLVSYTRTRNVTEVYYPEVSALLTELAKMPLCLLLLLLEARGSPFLYARMFKQQLFSQPIEVLKLSIPSLLYSFQNVLFYYAADHLSATAFMIAQQLKLFFAAIFAVLILRRRLNCVHWFALTALFIGVSVVQITSGRTNRPHQGSSSNGERQQIPLLGFGLTLVGCLTSGFSGVFLEMVYKKGRNTSIWMRNVQMSLFMIPINFCFVVIKDSKKIYDTRFLYGFDWMVWTLVLWLSVGSMTVAVCLKYADIITKDMATSMAIILATIASVLLFNFKLSWMFCTGSSMVIGAIFLYSYANRIIGQLQKHIRWFRLEDKRRINPTQDPAPTNVISQKQMNMLASCPNGCRHEKGSNEATKNEPKVVECSTISQSIVQEHDDVKSAISINTTHAPTAAIAPIRFDSKITWSGKKDCVNLDNASEHVVCIEINQRIGGVSMKPADAARKEEIPKNVDEKNKDEIAFVDESVPAFLSHEKDAVAKPAEREERKKSTKNCEIILVESSKSSCIEDDDDDDSDNLPFPSTNSSSISPASSNQSIHNNNNDTLSSNDDAQTHTGEMKRLKNAKKQNRYGASQRPSSDASDER